MTFLSTISTSKATPVVAVAYVVIGTLIADLLNYRIALPIAGILVACYLVEQLNVRQSLLRVASRMTACLLMLFGLATTRLLPTLNGVIVLVVFVVFLLLIFSTYQDSLLRGRVFFAYAMIGVVSLFFVQILFFVPFLWVMMVVWMRSLSLRGFVASIMGIAVPYWFWGIYCLYTLDAMPIASHFVALATFQPLCSGLFEPHLLTALVVLTIVDAIGIAHFLRHSSDDNIKCRMLHFTLMTIGILCLIFLVLQPQHKDYLMYVYMLCTSVMAAHYFTTAEGKAPRYVFLCLMFVVVLATIVNIWGL